MTVAKAKIAWWLFKKAWGWGASKIAKDLAARTETKIDDRAVEAIDEAVKIEAPF